MRKLRRPPRGGAGSPAFPSRWRLREARLIADTRTSRIWRVLQGDRRAIVKALKPAGRDELAGAALLRWRRGRGLVRLYATSGTQLLLEDAGDATLGDRLRRDDDDIAATAIAADVLAALVSGSSAAAPRTLRPLARHYASLFARARGTAADDPYREGARVAERLLRNARDERPLHGDLHHDNILQSSRGWIAIDPAGLYGDPAFDAANLLYNPLDRDDLCLSADVLWRRAETYARVLDLAPPQVLAHAYAYGCLSAAWHAEDGNADDEARELRVAAVIRELLRQ